MGCTPNCLYSDGYYLTAPCPECTPNEGEQTVRGASLRALRESPSGRRGVCVRRFLSGAGSSREAGLALSTALHYSPHGISRDHDYSGRGDQDSGRSFSKSVLQAEGTTALKTESSFVEFCSGDLHREGLDWGTGGFTPRR